MYALLFCMFLGVPKSTFIVDINRHQIVAESSIEEPVVIRVSDIDEEMVAGFTEEMIKAQTTGQSVIPIYISSYGGQVHAALEMIDVIKASKIPVATIAVGKAMSAGAVLLAMGAEGMRYAAPNATIMIHEVSTGAVGKLKDIEISVDEAKRVQKLFYKLMAENLGKPPDFFLRRFETRGHTNWYITPKEALSLGLINKIGLPTLRVVVKTHTVLE